MIDVDKIVHNPYQPRKDFEPQALEELKNSILEHGVITAITVRRAVNGYELISGERRLRASISAGLKKLFRLTFSKLTPMSQCWKLL